MKFSIIICTRNRSADLKNTLESFSRQKNNHQTDYEILVVDNASTDETSSVVHQLKPLFDGRLRYINEARVGIPFARNCGIKESSGDVIVFIDDDCLPADDYLFQLNHAFDGLDESVGFIGGKISPLFEEGVNIPQWLRDYPFFWGPLAVLNYGEHPFNIGKEQIQKMDRLFFSANLIVKKELFDRYGGISENKLLTGDTDFCLRILSQGILGRYEPKLLVRHKIDQERLAPETYHRWFYLRGQYRDLTFHYTPKFYYPFGIPTPLLRRVISHYIRSLTAQHFGEKLHLQCWTHFYCGQAVKIFKKIGMVDDKFVTEISGDTTTVKSALTPSHTL